MYIVSGKDIRGEINLDNRQSSCLGSIKVDNYKLRIQSTDIGIGTENGCFNMITDTYNTYAEPDIFPSFELMITYLNIGSINYKVGHIDNKGIEWEKRDERVRFEYMIRYGIDIKNYELIGFREFVKKVINKATMLNIGD